MLLKRKRGKKNYFLHIDPFYLRSETSLWPLNAAHYPNEKTWEKLYISSYEHSKWKSLRRETIIITYYLEMNSILRKAKVRTSRGKVKEVKEQSFRQSPQTSHKAAQLWEWGRFSQEGQQTFKKQNAMLLEKIKKTAHCSISIYNGFKS